MSRRRRWKAPNNPTAAARQVWAALFPREDWPKGWRVEWAGFMRGALGLTIYGERRVLLSWSDHAGGRRLDSGPNAGRWQTRGGRLKDEVLDTLLHEFVHVRAGKTLRHGQEFTRMENAMRTKLGMEARAK